MTPMLRLRANDHLVRNGIRFRVLSRAKDGKINLFNMTSEATSAEHEATLLKEYIEQTLRIERRKGALSEKAQMLLEADFSDQSEKAKTAAEFRLPFVREMLKERRRRWSNADLEALIERVCRQMREEAVAAGKEPIKKAGPSPRSLRRWADRALALGFEDLADVRILVPRNHACGGKRDAFGDEVQTIMDGVVDDLLMVATPCPKNEAYRHLAYLVGKEQERLRKKYADDSIVLRIPSLRTFYRRLNDISEEQKTLTVFGRVEADRKHSLVGRGPQGGYLLHEVEVDHTIMDIIVICPVTGVPIGRPTITVALDRWSRMIVGVHVGLDAPGWRATMMCLRNAILPKEGLLACDPEDLRAANPWQAMGVMDFLILDNAPEFHSAALRSAALELGITLVYCPAGKPKYKGKTERLFRRMNVELIHQLAGTTFSNPTMRGKYDSKAEASLTLDQLRAFVHRWIADIYCEKEHSFTKMTPNDRWNLGLQERNGVSLPESADKLMVSLAEVEYRKLTSKGVELYGLHYSNPRDAQLRAMFNAPDAPKAVKVRVNSDDLGTVKVEDFRQPGFYIEVPCIDAHYASGLSLAEHHQIAARARIALKARQSVTIAMLAESKAKLREDVERVREARELTSTKMNATYPAPTGKITDIGEDGEPIPTPKASPARRQMRDNQSSQLLVLRRRTSGTSFD